MDPYVGRTIGRKYRIDRRLAASSSGIVFAATQMHQDTELGSVVIKMLPKKAIKDQKIVKRFVDEARAARTLTNPHVVRVFDLDHDTGHVPYLVQEYVEGEPLNEIVVQEGRLRPVRTLAIALQIAEGMEEAHQKQILHRNLQPTNVIIRARLHEDFVKVIGFGMYETLDRTGGHRTLGAERYLAPEQLEGRGEDERTDIHALGVIVHEMLTGEAPVPGGPGLAELLPEADANLIDVVEMMLEHDPGNRPENMRKVVSLLEQVAQELGLNLDITGRFTLPPDVDEGAKKPQVVPPELPGETARGKASKERGRFHPAVIALAALAALILLAALLLGAYRLGALLYARQTEPVEQAVPGPTEPEAVEQPPPAEKTVPERGAGIEPAEEEPPAGEASPPVKKKPRPGKKKPRPGKKKQDTPWTKL
jgi:serine/threonine-protein kinase